MHRRSFPFAALAAFGLAALARIAFAAPIAPVPSLMPVASSDAGALDTPGVSPLQAMPTGMLFDVAAGPSGAPAGFSIDWMTRSNYDALGGWPDALVPGVTLSHFYGTPTLYTFQTTDYQLEPGGHARVVLGYLFDETGVGSNDLSELAPSTEYVLRIRAEGTGTLQPSANSATMSFTTTAVNNCTWSWGWWKNHPAAWPVTSLTLGTVTYAASQLMQILNTAANGNGLISLAHQLIAAKLNIAQGANPIPIGSTVASADALIGSLVVPPIGSGFLSPASTASLTNTLDQYNNGLLSVEHCDVVPTRPATWGTLKTHYR